MGKFTPKYTDRWGHHGRACSENAEPVSGQAASDDGTGGRLSGERKGDTRYTGPTAPSRQPDALDPALEVLSRALKAAWRSVMPGRQKNRAMSDHQVCQAMKAGLCHCGATGMLSVTTRHVSLILFSLLMVIENARGAGFADVIRSIPDLQVQVVVLAAARKTLMPGRESITVSASGYGWPVTQRQASADEVGQIILGRADISLPAEGGMTCFTPQRMKTARRGWISGEVCVNVTV